jgi:hypothetical protein
MAWYVRPTKRMVGPRPGGPVRWRSGPRCRNGTHVPGTLGARSPRASHTHDGAAARSPMAQCLLAGGKVLLMSLRGPQGGRRVRRSGRSSPEHWRGVRAVEDASGGGVHRQGGSSGDG